MPARPRCLHRQLVALMLLSVCLVLLTLPTAAQTTLTPEPTLTPTPTPEPNLLLIAEANVLTLVVTAESVNLTGFGFGVLIGGEVVVIDLADRVDALVLLRNTAPAGACFQFVVSGETPVLPSACTNRGYLYRVQVSAADQFWYDRLGNRLRDVGIVSVGELTGQLCSGVQLEVGCEVVWDEATIPTPTPTSMIVTPVPVTNTSIQLTPTPSSPTQQTTSGSYPCLGSIMFTTGAFIQVKVTPSSSSPNRLPVQQGASVQLLNRQFNDQKDWYQISYPSNQGTQTGWVLAESVTDFVGCP